MKKHLKKLLVSALGFMLAVAFLVGAAVPASAAKYDPNTDWIAGKYGIFLWNVTWNILRSHSDAEECVNDTYLRAWNAIPPQKPTRLSAFLGKITRNLALKKYEYLSAAKRNPEAVCSFSELEDCVSGHDALETELESRRIEEAISNFLRQLSAEKRTVFLRRYWYFDSIASISARCGFRESKVTTMLYQTRKQLRMYQRLKRLSLKSMNYRMSLL